LEGLTKTSEAPENLVEENERLRSLVATLEGEKSCLAERCDDLERRNTSLANLYVASYRLHGTLDREEVLAAIQEILANLVGSVLKALSTNGVDAARYDTVTLGSGVIGRLVGRGEIALFGAGGTEDAPAEEPALTALVPLKLGDRIVGAIAVFKLLPQKPRLEDVDRELFELLATQASTALYCTRRVRNTWPGEA
jgi:nitrate/nitrite-specific signal transduction histidine kinase